MDNETPTPSEMPSRGLIPHIEPSPIRRRSMFRTPTATEGGLTPRSFAGSVGVHALAIAGLFVLSLTGAPPTVSHPLEKTNAAVTMVPVTAPEPPKPPPLEKKPQPPKKEQKEQPKTVKPPEPNKPQPVKPPEPPKPQPVKTPEPVKAPETKPVETAVANAQSSASTEKPTFEQAQPTHSQPKQASSSATSNLKSTAENQVKTDLSASASQSQVSTSTTAISSMAAAGGSQAPARGGSASNATQMASAAGLDTRQPEPTFSGAAEAAPSAAPSQPKMAVSDIGASIGDPGGQPNIVGMQGTGDPHRTTATGGPNGDVTITRATSGVRASSRGTRVSNSAPGTSLEVGLPASSSGTTSTFEVAQSSSRKVNVAGGGGVGQITASSIPQGGSTFSGFGAGSGRASGPVSAGPMAISIGIAGGSAGHGHAGGKGGGKAGSGDVYVANAAGVGGAGSSNGPSTFQVAGGGSGKGTSRSGPSGGQFSGIGGGVQDTGVRGVGLGVGSGRTTGAVGGSGTIESSHAGGTKGVLSRGGGGSGNGGGPSATGEATGGPQGGNEGSPTGVVGGGGAVGAQGPKAGPSGSLTTSGAEGKAGPNHVVDNGKGLLKPAEQAPPLFDPTGHYTIPGAVTTGDYNWHADTLGKLLASIRQNTRLDIRLQQNYAHLENPKELEKSPVLIFTGHQAFKLTDAQRAGLRKYVDDGGMVWGDYSHTDFDQSFRNEMKATFGKDPVQLPPGQQIYASHYHLDGAPPETFGETYPLEGIYVDGERLGVVITRNRYFGAMDGPPHVTAAVQKAAFEVGTNIVAYAVHWYQQINGPQ